ncbi:MAG TPA: hypothetical protein VK254_02885, partial [Candidatus Bathyarchaeia archaeon]|nr:hypothetical protein [Candidatus Bathyarchaeia archaeon]
KKESKREVVDLDSKSPVKANSIHAGPVVQKIADRTKIYRTGPTWKTSMRKPVHEISTEERIADLENDIGQFGDGERRYVRKWVDIYPDELLQEIQKRKNKGGKITDKAVAAIRLSLINHIAKWGMDRGVAPEKSRLIERYLGLKLPHGIPPKSPEELHIGEREAIKKTEKERVREKTDLFMKQAADARQAEIEKQMSGKGTQAQDLNENVDEKSEEEKFSDRKKQFEEVDAALLELYRTIPEKMWIVKKIKNTAEAAIEKLKARGKWEDIEVGERKRIVGEFSFREFKKYCPENSESAEEKVSKYIINSLNI